MMGTSLSRAEVLTDIEAHQARITPLQMSHSGRVYRFKMDPASLPKTGNIILVSDDQKPVMAFRVLKTEEGTGELIAKRVRRYDTTGELKLNENYTEIEKIADLVTPPPPEPSQYVPGAQPELDPNISKTLKPVPRSTPAPDVNAPPLLDGTSGLPHQSGQETTPSSSSDMDNPSAPSTGGMDVEKFDSDLDNGSSPRDLKSNSHSQTPPQQRYQQTQESLDEEIPSQMIESKSNLEVVEKTTLWPYQNMIGFQVGSYRNTSNFSFSNMTQNSGFSGTYSHLLQRNVFIQHSPIQDSLNLEGAFTYYSRSNFTGNNDTYTILPLRAELRYDVYLSEYWAFAGYVGLQYNFLLGTDNVNVASFPVEDTAKGVISGPQFTLGVGIFYNIGPQWYLRADLGWDRLALGLSVKW